MAAATQTSSTKAKIIDASLSLFSQKGYESTSVREIAKALDMSQGSLYNHFKNKDSILKHLIDEFVRSFLSDIFSNDELEAQAKSGFRLLRNIAMQFSLSILNNRYRSIYMLMMQELYKNGEIRRYFTDELFGGNAKRLSSCFFIMMQEEMIISGDPLMYANEFLSSLFFYQNYLTLLTIDNQPTSTAKTLFDKHAQNFWNQIKIDKEL